MDKSQKKDINTVTKSLLVLLFSFVIFTISGISYSFAEHVEHISVREQLKQDISFQELQCYNSNHVLTIRDNGKAACVTEVMAQKLDWIIIQRHFAIHSTPEEVRSVYGGRAEIPRDEDGNYVFKSGPGMGVFKSIITMSHPPKLEESVHIKAMFIDIYEYRTMEGPFYGHILIPEGFELISDTLVNGTIYKKGEFIDGIFTVGGTIKSVKPGSWDMSVFGPGTIYNDVSVVITEHGSYFLSGHFPKKYVEYLN